MPGCSRWARMLAMYSQPKALEAQGVQEGAAYFVRAVNLTQGDDLLDVMRGVEPLFPAACGRKVRPAGRD